MTENDKKVIRVLTALMNGGQARVAVARNHVTDVKFEAGDFLMPVQKTEFRKGNQPMTSTEYLPLDWAMRDFWYYCAYLEEEEIQAIESTVPIGS